ncbi:hypothetical protein AB0H51_01240 [Streptomyces griseoluteus]|uniref:hypothetical protein n=1 Tax=Streptomyces griseoluteus TaxID=29306 RepID=UPI0033FAD9D9
MDDVRHVCHLRPQDHARRRLAQVVVSGNAPASRAIPGLRTIRLGERRRKVKQMDSYRRIVEAFPAAASPTGGG